jgi:hypothetical protein
MNTKDNRKISRITMIRMNKFNDFHSILYLLLSLIYSLSIKLIPEL